LCNDTNSEKSEIMALTFRLIGVVLYLHYQVWLLSSVEKIIPYAEIQRNTKNQKEKGNLWKLA